MDIQKLTIGQMATLNHITTQALRHYDKEGLLSPWITDGQTGYRYYHINQCARLDMILSLQTHGISLENIKEHLNLIEHDHEATLELLKSQLAVLTDDMQKLSQSKSAIARMIFNYEKYKNLPRDGTVFFEFMPSRKVFICKTEFNFFEQNMVEYEMMLRELKGSLLLHNLPVGYFCNVGTFVRKTHLDAATLYSDEVFLFLDGDYDVPGLTEEIPASMYVCICSHQISDEAAHAEKLLKTIRESGYRIIGDYICEVVLDFPGLAASPRNALYKIQIPIQK